LCRILVYSFCIWSWNRLKGPKIKGMSKELLGVLIQVITSWQVLAVTGVLIIYLFLVLYAARTHKRPGAVARTTAVRREKKGAPPTGEPDVETLEGDDLGLTEE
jgi:uncharacterized membrane protein